MDRRKRLLLIGRIFDFFRFAITLLILIALVVIGVHFFRIGLNFVMIREEVKHLPIDIQIRDGDEYEIDIPWGYNTDDIAVMLQEKGIIDNPFLFSIWAKFIGYEGKFTAGTHRLDRTSNYNTLDGYEKLMYILSRNPRQNPDVRVFIPEGSTWKQTQQYLINAGIPIDDDFWEQVLAHDFSHTFWEHIKEDIQNEHRLNPFEGYLFPDTYIMNPDAPPVEIIKKFFDNFEVRFREEFYTKAEELGLSVDEIIIIASIIEKEAQLDEEREVISGVIYNRMNSSDTSLHFLQMDSTIMYHYLMTTGEVKPVLYTSDTRIDDPYNTYMYRGLPPGPICSPGLRSIIAALYPDEHDYYYFVARGDGSHQFSSTYEQHAAAVREYTAD